MTDKEKNDLLAQFIEECGLIPSLEKFLSNKGLLLEELTIPNYEWDLLVKKLGIIVNKTVELKKLSQWVPSRTNKSVEEIQDKALECLDIIKHRSTKTSS